MESETAKHFKKVGGTFVVVAMVTKGEPWRNVLTTTDLDYAEATRDQFKAAGVRVRIDGIFPVAKKGKRR